MLLREILNFAGKKCLTSKSSKKNTLKKFAMKTLPARKIFSSLKQFQQNVFDKKKIPQ